MNKKLLTAAIGAALVAAPMFAGTAQADVKVYGKLHVSVDRFEPGNMGTTDTLGRSSTHVSNNSTRWGIDVSEKLGGGMSAIGKVESDIDVTGETASQNSRNRYVGLKGGFGTVVAGIYDTPFKEISRSVELFPEQVGDTRNLVSTGGNSGSGWDLRPTNVVRYDSPSLGGFVINYLYSADATASTTVEDNRRRADSLGVKYSQGPLYAAFAYETHRFNNVADSGNPTEKGYRLGASYNFGAFKVVGLYQDLKDLGGTSSGSTAVKRKAWALGGAYTAGNNVFKVQYVKADKLSNTSAGASADNTGAKMWSLGWDHLFSKTTKAYVAYAKTDNETSANFTVNSGGHGDTVTPNAGGDPSAWSVGMIVDF